MKRWLRELWRDSPGRAVVLPFVVFSLAGMFWDLPTTFGWENDAAAPRDLFGGLAGNLTPGGTHRYPLLQYLLVALGSLPFLIAGVVGADGWSREALQEAMLSTPTMTAVALVARGLSLAQGTGALLVLGRLVARVASPRAGTLASLALATNLTFGFYARTANLDVPHLFWVLVAAEQLLLVLREGTLRSYLGFGACAAAAVATKDQAYAAFTLTAPVYLLLLPALGRRLPAGAAHWKRLGAATAVGAAVLGVAGGGLLNPTGFARRLGVLTGTNSQDWRLYAPGIEGLMQNLRDVAVAQGSVWWPWLLVALGWGGLLRSFRGPDRAERLLLAVVGISSLATFTLLVGRSEHRFLLVPGACLSGYVGTGADVLLAALERRKARWGQVLVAALFAAATVAPLVLLATQWGDARRRVESWLERVPPGTRVETYGLTVYQPRFRRDGPYRVARVDPAPARRRNPLVEADEVEARYMAVMERRPDVLVIPEAFAVRHVDPTAARGIAPETDLADAREFFGLAYADRLPGYRGLPRVTPRLPRWMERLGAEPVEIHSTAGPSLRLLVRDGFGAPEPPP